MTVWALGDYSKVANHVLAGLGRTLVAACGVSAGQRVLDVAAGTGNAALPAAEAGARVIASDITPELLSAGRREAEARGIEVEWVEADAQALPFPDGGFDVVLSCLGAMFAPDQRAAARELLRVCRPGGVIGMVNWTPGSWSERFFAVLAGDAPPPVPAPTAWGSEAHVRELLGGAVTALSLERDVLVMDHFATPPELCAFYREHFGPTVAAFAGARDVGALERDFLAFATETDRGRPGGPATYDLEYLRVVARR